MPRDSVDDAGGPRLEPLRSRASGPRASVRAIARAAVELTSRHDREAVLDAILAELERLVPVDMASVMRLEGGALRVLAGRGFRRDATAEALTFRPGQNPRLDRALQARGTVRFTDPDEPDPFDGLSETALGHVHSCMATPMRLDGRLLGLITADAHAAGCFDDEHAELMELFGALAAVAIHNADLVTELEHARARLEGEVATLAAEIREAAGTAIVGASPAVKALREEIGLVGPTDTAVLIFGETGTGKELVARALHAASSRASKPLIRFDASAVAPTLIESELFGHARGAFTGAVESRPGKFEIADGGTLFLDEIGELPLEVQPRLLRALQEHEVERVGDHHTVRFDARIIAATNRDLRAEVRAGRFRADLFHRLAVYPIALPPLRERLDDLGLLVEHFAHKLAPRLQLESVKFTDAFLAELADYAWPGNVRELENTVERALVRGRALGRRSVELGADAARGLGLRQATGPVALPSVAPVEKAPHGTLVELTDRFELQLIERAIAAEGGNVAAAARQLGEDRSNLLRRLRRLRRPPG